MCFSFYSFMTAMCCLKDGRLEDLVQMFDRTQLEQLCCLLKKIGLNVKIEFDF